MRPRCVVHIDADCFYAAVERRRLKIPIEEPLAVQQWSGLIAVDYAARKFGVKRGMLAAEAQKLCPGIHLIHVELLGKQDGIKDENTKKVSLARYRKASFEMMQVFSRFLGSKDVFCRASVDEAYIDLSDSVYQVKLENNQDFANYSSLIGDLDRHNPWDVPLINASKLVHDIRKAVWVELGLTVSAGIANNRMVAKVASSQNKPNKQTIIARSHWKPMLSDLPIRSIPGLGGKFGAKVEAFLKPSVMPSEEKDQDHLLVSVLQQADRESLVKKFGNESGNWLCEICVGNDTEPVLPRDKPKSILAMKSFKASSDTEFISEWIGILASEVNDRCVEDKFMFNRLPKSLVLHHRGMRRKDNPSNAGCTIRTQLSGKLSSRLIHDVGLKLLQKVQHPFPCSRIGLSLTDFVDVPRSNVSTYFTQKQAKPKTTTVPPKPAVQPPPKVNTGANERLTWDNVDAEMLSALPDDIRKEVEASIQSAPKKRRRNGQQSIHSFFNK